MQAPVMQFHHSIRQTIRGFSCRFCLLLSLAFLGAIPAHAECPEDPEPQVCEIDGQLFGGRWDLSALTGTYEFSGVETYGRDRSWIWPFHDTWEASGSFNVEMLDGPAENYVDVECDGTVTGKGHEKISGTLTKTFLENSVCVNTTADGDMVWDVIIEREYTITGEVTGFGQMDIERTIDTATVSIQGNFYFGIDCVIRPWNEDPPSTFEVLNFDLSGDTESARLTGNYNPGAFQWMPEETPLGDKTWLEDILKRFELSGHVWEERPGTIALFLHPVDHMQTLPQQYNTYFVQDAVTITQDVEAAAEPTTPAVLALVLQEPAQYLIDVPFESTVVATIDWRGQSPGEVQFTYGSTVEVVAGAETVDWAFDTGEPATSIEVIAIQGAEQSEPYIINIPKVSVPGWAGAAADWSADSGIQYQSVIDWPISLEATRTLNTISLFTGLWGINAKASSELESRALSNGSPLPGTLEAEASMNFAGKGVALNMAGPNETTLSCDSLIVSGSGTVTVPSMMWEKTINPITLIPGVQTAACSLSGFLCQLVNIAGIKASATATLGGTGTYTGEQDEIRWDGGSLDGAIGGEIGIAVQLPKPLSKVAGIAVSAGADGCIEFQFSPELALTSLGGAVEASAQVTFLGMTVGVEDSLPFGDGCAGAAVMRMTSSKPAVSTAFVPADGQLAMAAVDVSGDLLGIAVWSEPTNGATRPVSDIRYRFFRNGQWGEIRDLTSDAVSNTAPTVEFDTEGRALVVYQRNVASPPNGVDDLPGFSNGFELHYGLIDPVSELSLDDGALTGNNLNDFGPQLIRDAEEKLHLFWQRSNGIDITGTLLDPASIEMMSWNSVSETWGVEINVASGLIGTYGWSPAAWSNDQMQVALIIDEDQDYSTEADRELFQILRDTGTWLAKTQVTNDTVADDSVLASYDDTGQPIMLWRHNAAVLQLRGSSPALPSNAFTTPDPTLDEGVSTAFAHGMSTATNDGMMVVWGEGPRLLMVQSSQNNSTLWNLPEAPFDTEGRTVHALRDSDQNTLFGYAARTFDPQSAPSDLTVEPRFIRIQSQSIFTDSFEGGN